MKQKMKQNTIPGSRRQTTVSRSGEALERGYLYLKPEAWAALYAAAKVAGVSASVYIESIIPTVSGTYQVRENNVSTHTRQVEHTA
jgi:hypothetical protein